MKFRVVLSQGAKRDLLALPRNDQIRILIKLDDTALDPAHYFRRLKGSTALRMRFEDLRIIADVDPMERSINVLKVAHRRNVYDH